MATFDKSVLDRNATQYATRVKRGDVGRYVLLPGDPDRVGRIGKHLDDVREIAACREFVTITGTYRGVTVSVTSTGVGCPSASIAVEELINAGATHFIRVGSTAALQPNINTGDIVINTAIYRNDGTSRMYVPDTYPAVADHFFAHSLIKSAQRRQASGGYELHVGLSSCDDAFYAETPEWIAKLSQLGMLNVEMEGSAIFTVAQLRGVSAAMVCGVSGNLVVADYDYEEGEHGNQRLVDAWENAISIALEAIVAHDAEHFADSPFVP